MPSCPTEMEVQFSYYSHEVIHLFSYFINILIRHKIFPLCRYSVVSASNLILPILSYIKNIYINYNMHRCNRK
jgi:hypothetical protein